MATASAEPEVEQQDQPKVLSFDDVFGPTAQAQPKPPPTPKQLSFDDVFGKETQATPAPALKTGSVSPGPSATTPTPPVHVPIAGRGTAYNPNQAIPPIIPQTLKDFSQGAAIMGNAAETGARAAAKAIESMPASAGTGAPGYIQKNLPTKALPGETTPFQEAAGATANELVRRATEFAPWFLGGEALGAGVGALELPKLLQGAAQTMLSAGWTAPQVDSATKNLSDAYFAARDHGVKSPEFIKAASEGSSDALFAGLSALGVAHGIESTRGALGEATAEAHYKADPQAFQQAAAAVNAEVPPDQRTTAAGMTKAKQVLRQAYQSAGGPEVKLDIPGAIREALKGKAAAEQAPPTAPAVAATPAALPQASPAAQSSPAPVPATKPQPSPQPAASEPPSAPPPTPATISEAIRQAGGVFKGIQEGHGKIPPMAMLDDPETRSTLSVPLDASPLQIFAIMDQSRKRFAAQPEPAAPSASSATPNVANATPVVAPSQGTQEQPNAQPEAVPAAAPVQAEGPAPESATVPAEAEGKDVEPEPKALSFDNVFKDEGKPALPVDSAATGEPTHVFEDKENGVEARVYPIQGGKYRAAAYDTDAGHVVDGSVRTFPDQDRAVAYAKKFEAKPDHEFSSTQVNLPAPVAKKVLAVGKDLIPDADLAPEHGREDQPHVTVKFGLHGNDPEKVAELLKDEPPIKVTLGKTSVFKNVEDGTADAVKVDVDSPDLHRLNAKIAAALPNTDTHPEYVPHLTLAYVKPGLGEKYAGSDALAGQTVTLNNITFSGKDRKETDIPLSGKAGAKPQAVQEQPKSAGGAGAPTLPRELAGAKPRYNYRDKEFTLDFASDIDKAAYIAAQAKPSKQDAAYIDFVRKATGATEQQVRGHGKFTRDVIKQLAAKSEPGELNIPASVEGQKLAMPQALSSFAPHLPLNPPSSETVPQATTSSSGVTVTRNEAKNGIEVRFEAKPTPETIFNLKKAGFRWTPKGKAWYKKYSPEAMDFANKVAGMKAEEPAKVKSYAINDAIQAVRAAGGKDIVTKADIVPTRGGLVTPNQRIVFTDPGSGTEIELPLSEATPERVKQEVEKARAASKPEPVPASRYSEPDKPVAPIETAPTPAESGKVEKGAPHEPVIASDRGEAGTRPVGQGHNRPLEGASPDDVQRTPATGNAGEGRPRGAGKGAGHGARVVEEGNGRGTSLGDREGTGLSTADEVTPESEETGQLPRQPTASDYRIQDSDNIGHGGLVEKYNRNVEAIKLLKQIEAEGRAATPAEQSVLVRYVGWGALSQVFKEYHPDWGVRARELRDLLTEERQAALNQELSVGKADADVSLAEDPPPAAPGADDVNIERPKEAEDGADNDETGGQGTPNSGPSAPPKDNPPKSLYGMIAVGLALGAGATLSDGSRLEPSTYQDAEKKRINLAVHPLSIRVDLGTHRLQVLRHGSLVAEFPIAAGAPVTPSPTGSFGVVEKQEFPKPEGSDVALARKLYGKQNPFGTRWIGFHKVEKNGHLEYFGIHGTHAPELMGQDVSHGCIRMRNEDVEKLYDMVNIETPVDVIPAHPFSVPPSALGDVRSLAAKYASASLREQDFRHRLFSMIGK